MPTPNQPRQTGLLSLPLPDGVALCLRCPWGDRTGGPEPARRHTRETSHPTVYRPARTPTTEVPHQ